VTKFDVPLQATVWLWGDDFLPVPATVVSRVGYEVAAQKADGEQASLHTGHFGLTEDGARRAALAAALRAADYHRERSEAAGRAARTLGRLLDGDGPGPAGAVEFTGLD
jgi:hypothetical protein